MELIEIAVVLAGKKYNVKSDIATAAVHLVPPAGLNPDITHRETLKVVDRMVSFGYMRPAGLGQYETTQKGLAAIQSAVQAIESLAYTIRSEFPFHL